MVAFETQFWAAGFVLFIALFVGVANLPESSIGDGTREGLFLTMCLLFGVGVNVCAMRWLRAKKKAAEEAIEQREKEDVKKKREQKEAVKKVEEAKKMKEKPKPTPAVEEAPPTDGSNVDADAYRPKKKAIAVSKDLDKWDEVDYKTELKMVDGSELEYGELTKKDKHKQEMMEMFVKDPVGMEKAVKQAEQMKKLKQAEKKINAATSAVQSKEEQAAQHRAKLEESMKKTGVSGQVFAGSDLNSAEGLGRLQAAMGTPGN